MKQKVMISFCDKSGNMAKPWAENGYLCYCVDLQHPVRSDKVVEFEGGGKIVFTYGDARYWTVPDRENIEVVFFASFPVCTNMAGSGAQDYSNKNGRIPKKGIPQLMDGLMLFNSCYHAASWSGAPFITENPSGVIPTHFRKADFTFHPWFYGDMYQKNTCLWTGNGFKMPDALYDEKPDEVTQEIWIKSPGKDRQDFRSLTPLGFAYAIYEANKPSQ